MTGSSRPTGDIADEVTHSWTTWAQAAENIDRHEVALALLEAAPNTSHDAATAVFGATLLLQIGQHAQAVAVLAGIGYSELPDENRATWPDLVLAASRAAGGDSVAYRWLMGCARRFDGTAEAWRLCYLVAAAATGINDRATADQAWDALLTRYEILTPATLAQYSAAQVADRDQHDAGAATMTVATAVANLHQIGTPLEQNPEPALRIARLLQSRGDLSGSRLLLHAARRRIPPDPALDAALAEVTPASAMHRHRLIVTVLWCLAPLLFPLGVVGGLLVLAARLAWQRWVPIPGLSRTDSAIWRAFRSLSYDPYTDPDEPAPKDQTGYYGLAAILSLLFVAAPLGSPVSALLAGLTATANNADNPLVVATWLLLCIGIPGLSFLGARQVHRERRARRHRRRRQAEHRARMANAQRCHCWQAASASGQFATLYFRQHLRPEPFTLRAPNLRGLADLGRCPTTGVLWLALDKDDPGKALLLRGTSRTNSRPEPTATGMYI